MAGVERKLGRVDVDEVRDIERNQRAQPESAERHGLLERDAELAVLDTALAACRDGAGRLTVVEGPAGIGKSSVLSAARSRADTAGFRVLRARGSELETAFSYGIVRQLFESVLASADESLAFDGAAAHAARLFDAAAAVDKPATGNEADFALMHGLYWLTVNLAESGPMLIAVDDLQWADGASLRWFSYLARRLEGLSVGALAAVRTGEAEDPVVTELLADPNTNIARPAALSAAAVAKLVRTGLEADGDDAFCRACHRATGGNPLLVRELVRTIADRQIAPTAAAAETVSELAPDAVARSVRARMSRLPAESVAVAHAVAVLGDGTDGRYVAAFAHLDPRTLGFAASALARVDLLRPEASFRFVHPLVRAAVYASVPAHERAQEHARAAQVLVAEGAPLAAVAAQLLHAPPGTVDRATATLRDAARGAADNGAPESAVRYLQRALDERMDDEERGELLLDLADSEFRLGKAIAVERLREAVTHLRDKQRRQEAYLRLAQALYYSSHEDAVRVLEQALGERSDDDGIRRQLEVDLIANAMQVPSRQVEVRHRLEAMPFDEVAGDEHHLLLGLHAFHEATLGRNLERAVARAESALSLTAGPSETAARARLRMIYVPLLADHLDAGIRLIEAELAGARRRGAIFGYSAWMVMRGVFRYAAGALGEAETDLRSALDTLASRGILFFPHVYAYLAQVLVERNAVDEAAELLDTVAATFGSIAKQTAHLRLFRARGMVVAARGDHHAALHQALTVGQLMEAVGNINPAISYPGWRSEAARAHHALGAESEALSLAREEVKLARAWGAPRALGRALRTLGSIEGGDEGMAHIREAVDVLEPSPARLEFAYALADLGAGLRRGNQRTAARDPLRRALELAQRCGANRLADLAHKELLATGARPRRRELTGAEALTPSERRVANMAADGLSNREIAQSLFVTLRTVEMHLSGAFRKLDISSRTQLAAALSGGRLPTDAG